MFYPHAYLHAFKRFFAPDKLWLYAKLSPLVGPACSKPIARDYGLKPDALPPMPRGPNDSAPASCP